MQWLLVFAGGGIGAVMRHGVNRTALVWLGPNFPYGTLLVNVAGGLLMGVVAELLALRSGASQELRLFLATGMLGGFTTFSAFSLDAALMWQKSQWLTFTAYVTGSVLLSIGGLFAGMATMRSVM